MPIAIGDLRGTVSGEERAVSRRGLADVVVRLAVNLAGGPALALAEFMKTPPRSVMFGASVKVIAPTGQYDPARLINIGTNRWAFKPELGYTAKAGRFVLDAFAGIWFFTANDIVRGQCANPGAPRERRSRSARSSFTSATT